MQVGEFDLNFARKDNFLVILNIVYLYMYLMRLET